MYYVMEPTDYYGATIWTRVGRFFKNQAAAERLAARRQGARVEIYGQPAG